MENSGLIRSGETKQHNTTWPFRSTWFDDKRCGEYEPLKVTLDSGSRRDGNNNVLVAK